MFGKLFHLGLDALLISAFLAGVKRSTGLTFVKVLDVYNLSLILLVDLSSPRSLIKIFDVGLFPLSHDLLIVIIFHYRTSAIILRDGYVMEGLQTRRCTSHMFVTCAGEYAFDFAVVVFGVSPS